MKSWILCIALILGWGATRNANAQEWVLCDTCISQQDFESAAAFTAPQITGSYLYAVGNTQAGEFYYVQVNYRREGDDVTFGNQGSSIFADLIDRSSVVTTRSYHHALLYTGNGITTAASVAASADENAQFAAMVQLSRNEILVAAPSDIDGLGSFGGAQMEILGPYLWVKMSAQNPAWQSGAIGTGWISNLINILKYAYGKGPSACIVFQNGDSACYEMNPLDKNAAAYIKGTAKSLSGQLLDQTNGVGDGTALTIQNPEPGVYAWGRNDGVSYSLWLFCSSVGGTIDRCWTEILQN